jgi:hypothetical protein
MEQLNTPVLLIIFNRPETTAIVFDAIRAVRPKNLFVFADGPRNESDLLKCQLVREYIINGLDWDCELVTNFQEKNLGCGPGPASAISWFFLHVEYGIILEDDCVACPKFFYFCDELLRKYASSSKIMHISGTNLQFSKRYGEASYYFSKYPIPWGWATWRRGWEKFDLKLSNWPRDKKNRIFDGHFSSDIEMRFWSKLWDSILNGRSKDIWDAQWAYACHSNDALTIVPNSNLIQNIGWGADATHHKEKQIYLDLEFEYFQFPLLHPIELSSCVEADVNTRELLFPHVALTKRVSRRLLLIFKKINKLLGI